MFFFQGVQRAADDLLSRPVVSLQSPLVSSSACSKPYSMLALTLWWHLQDLDQ